MKTLLSSGGGLGKREGRGGSRLLIEYPPGEDERSTRSLCRRWMEVVLTIVVWARELKEL